MKRRRAAIDYLDMLAKLGVGNAHPGGYKETLEQLRDFPIHAGLRVLEVGCGTGRTACLLAEQGCEVTGLDIRGEMIAKAQRRAEKERVAANFIIGNAEQLPFEDAAFDVVLVESVTNFTDAKRSASEYGRVLKPGGVLYDREVIRRQAMPEPVHQALCTFYGVKELFDLDGWRRIWEAAGFQQIAFAGVNAFPKSMWEDGVEHPDPVKLSDEMVLLDPQIWQVRAEYDQLMEKYYAYLGYALMIGHKSER